MASKIIDLRNLLAERFPHAPATARAALITGLRSLDETIGGGFPIGAITEIISPQFSAGSASLIHSLVRIARHDGYFVALIDGRDSFDPTALENSSALLWVRCQKVFEAVKAADLLLRDGNFPLLIVDLVLNASEELRKIPQTSWYRLQRLAETTSTACLVLTRQNLVSSAQLKLVLENSWTLKTLEAENTTARLRFRIQRSHLSSAVSNQRFATANPSFGGSEAG
jgi:RecA/RadA recombinase